MTTHKEGFAGSDSSIDMNDNRGRGRGLERMIQREIADQVERVMRNI